MKYFKYWAFVRDNPPDESECCYVRAEDQDAATKLTEPPTGPFHVSRQTKVREIEESDLPEGATWIQ